MKKSLIVILFLIPVLVNAQHLMVQGSGGNLYLTHTTAPKENFYSIGRIYNSSPREFAPYNNIPLDKGLSLGQTVKIPLTGNFTQTNNVGVDEVAVPVFHKTAAKETLSTLSSKYNKVSPATLKTWNNLKSDAIAPGQDIIIGYIKVKKELSPLAQQAVTVSAAKEEEQKMTAPVVNKEESKKEEVKATPVKQPAVVKAEVPVKQTPPVVKTEPVQVKETPPVVKTVPVPEKKAAEPVAGKTEPAGDFKGGVFKELYHETGKSESGTAGVFKSLNGWDNGKYYCLMTSAQQGDIVKVTNKASGKTVYAKVIDAMPDLKQNVGLTLRISSAAASALGAGEGNFECTVNY